jgi:large subunit ribosomal protein L11
VGTLTWDDLRGVAKEKIKDMNTTSIESAARTLAGTARSMGIEVK